MVKLNESASKRSPAPAAPTTQGLDKVWSEPTPRAVPPAKVIGRDCDDGEEEMSLKIS